MEIWQSIPGASIYESSNSGRVRLKTGRILKQFQAIKSYPGGYLLCRIVFDDGKISNRLVHRLIAQTFLSNPDNKATVNHKNGNKLDNCLDNLEWATHSENIQHAYDTGLKKYRPLHYKGKFGFDHNRSKSVRCVETGEIFGSMSEAARHTKIDRSSIGWACRTGMPIFTMHWEINS